MAKKMHLMYLRSCFSSSNSMAFRRAASSFLNSVGIGLPSGKKTNNKISYDYYNVLVDLCCYFFYFHFLMDSNILWIPNLNLVFYCKWLYEILSIEISSQSITYSMQIYIPNGVWSTPLPHWNLQGVLSENLKERRWRKP